MDTYQQISDSCQRIPGFNNWDEIRTLFREIASGWPYPWSLPILACEAVGGTPDQAIATALAIACSHVSIILVDDMLDSDASGEYRRLGMHSTANMASAFQAAALEGIILDDMETNAKLSIPSCLNNMLPTTAFGQYLDTQPHTDEKMYWQNVKTKSSLFFSSALQIGALVGGSTSRMAQRLGKLGGIYGEMIQIHDDLNDVMAIPANPDWTQGRSPLLILFARLVEHPERARFLELCKNISDEGDLEEAQNILSQCGAVSYCVDQLLGRHEKGREILAHTSLVQRKKLENLFEEVIAPVQKLFQAIGEPLPTREVVYQE